MGRHSSCLKQKLRKGLWSPEEDEKLFNYITRYGVGCWSSVPKLAGLQRCGKSCRLRWINYLRPDLKRGMFSQQEEDLILRLHQVLGNRWAQIAAQLPGRTDNEIKNFWNSYLKKKLMKQGIDPATHKPIPIDQVKKKSDKASIDQNNGIEPLSLPPPFSIRMNEPAFLLGDTSISFPLNAGVISANNTHPFDPSAALEFHQLLAFTDNSTGYGTSMMRLPSSSGHVPANITGAVSFSSDKLVSRLSSMIFSESINRDPYDTIGYRLNSDAENGNTNNNNVAFSWPGSGYNYNKVNSCSSNQFELGEIKSEEIPRTIQWSQEDFGDYPLTSIAENYYMFPDIVDNFNRPPTTLTAETMINKFLA